MKHLMTLEEFVIRGKNSTKALVFDVDDTLVKSNAKVFVKKNGEIVNTLSSEEFNDYKLKKGETFSFEEFSDLNILLSADIKPYFNTLKREYERGVHISILTARSDSNMIHEFFIKKAGVDINPKLIFTIGSDGDSDMSGMSISERKAECIKKLADYGYKTLIFFDDNVDNLTEVKKMGDELGIKIHIVKA